MQSPCFAQVEDRGECIIDSWVSNLTQGRHCPPPGIRRLEHRFKPAMSKTNRERKLPVDAGGERTLGKR
jgi:hypothetical protein